MGMRVSDIADSDQIYQLQKELLEAEDKLARLVPQMGKALQVMEHDSDYRKRALSIAMGPFLEDGDSATKADALARATDGYGKELERLSTAYESAAATKSDWEYWKTRWKARQSLISLEKELANL